MTPRTETNRVMMHCTATPEGMEVTYDMLWQWHVVDNGWDHIGYHWLIPLDGPAVACRPEELEGAGCSGENYDTIHVSYAGGLEADGVTAKDTLTPAQEEVMIAKIKDIQTRYPHLDSACIVGHNQYAAKACPSFDVPTKVAGWLEDEAETGNPEPAMPSLPIGMEIAALYVIVAEQKKKIDDLYRWKNDNKKDPIAH